MIDLNKKNKMCSVVSVAKSGQIVICKKIREELVIEPGDELLVFVDKKKGLCFIKCSNFSELAHNILQSIE
ncbi:MAG: AbrB/MazE/SpoVT family DNA-binding domain-containing protein [Fusobacteriaceae bacterium]|nr:AbrB/MazE/SpoVT family DNA-binding domain-containing protein [Fusobacteriaceae bacterium]